MFPEIAKDLGLPAGPASRSNFYLYQKVEELAQKAGWEMVLRWEQTGIFPFLNGEELRPYGNLVASRMTHVTAEQQKQVEDEFVKRVSAIIA